MDIVLFSLERKLSPKGYPGVPGPQWLIGGESDSDVFPSRGIEAFPVLDSVTVLGNLQGKVLKLT